MCGIMGWLGPAKEDIDFITTKVLDTLNHRGPDDKGFESGYKWGLGFRRLSILDLSKNGHQPMFSLDKRYCIVFNGEIYNYIELKNEYLKEIHFQGDADSEVLLNLLIKYKEKALSLLNGMFAFTFVDTKTGDYIIARDRLGQKPFYYTIADKTLKFASELKTLLAWSSSSKILNENAVIEYLTIHYVSSKHSIFKNYHKLKPAHFISGNYNYIDLVEEKPYWKPEIKIDPTNKTSDEYIEEFKELFGNATNIRLRSDVPLGLFLSGGIDSGLVASFASQASNNPLLALSVSYKEKDFDEFDLASLTAKKYGLDLKKIDLPKSALADIDKLAETFDEPFADASALPTYNLCKAASEHAVVFLSGDGGDESFAGYRNYIESLNRLNYINTPDLVKLFARGLSKVFSKTSPIAGRLNKIGQDKDIVLPFFDYNPLSPFFEYVLKPNYFELQRRVISSHITDWRRSNHLDFTSRQQLFDQSLYLPDDILVKMDRASMAHSIEVRSPFLDHRVVEWANRLPRHLLLDKQTGKILLRKISEKLLPKEVVTARKKGFGVPLDHWFSQPEGINLLRARIHDSSFALKDQLNIRNVSKLIKLHQNSKTHNFGSFFWAILMFDAWSRKYNA